LKIAYVNGELISGVEYGKAYRDYVEVLRRQYRQYWSEELIRTLDVKNKALQNLIDQKLVSQEAKRLGLSVTEEEIQKAIMEYPAFQINGQFDLRQYQSLLSQNRMDPEDFEASMGQTLLEQKLSDFLFAFMAVTDPELRDHYTFENETIQISFIPFKPESFQKSITPDDKAVTEFFETHKENYRVPEKIRVAYLEFDPKEFLDEVEITDEEIASYYDEIASYYEYHLDTYTEPKQVKARHILFKLTPDAPEEEEETVKKRAREVLEKARKGNDFAELAKEYSEGPTKDKGGDLGYFRAGQMVKPFEEAAFAMKKGDIGDLVRTRFGYHIIKVEDVEEERTKSLDEVRDQIVQQITDSVTRELANEKALSLMDQMPYEVDLAQYAAEHERTVKRTEFFSEAEPIPELGGTRPMRQSLFALGEKETSDLLEINGKFYIFQVAERKASYIPELNDVADRVRKDLVSHLAKEKAREEAERYLAELRRGNDWDDLAKVKGLTPEITEFFNRRQSVPKIGNAPDLKETAFVLGKDNRYPEKVFETATGTYVIRWEGSQPIDEKKFEEEKEEYRAQIRRMKHGRAFQLWLEELRRKAKIEIVTPVT
jgi:peptidyl-prolyl cis-trans isomerase D